MFGEEIKKEKRREKSGERDIMCAHLSFAKPDEMQKTWISLIENGTVGEHDTKEVPPSYQLQEEWLNLLYDAIDGKDRDKTVRTGLLPKAMIKRDDAYLSGHATHEWVAMGKDAETLVSGHGLLDAPTGETSPLGKALEQNASVVFLGCHPGSNTFLHYVETMAGVSYTEPAVVQYVDKEGRRRNAIIDRHLFGCRNFYGGINAAYYDEAKKRGLHIYEVPFGLATLYRMELRELYDITAQMIKEDEFALLCKKPDCPFCKKNIK